jgi:hypothetical protein
LFHIKEIRFDLFSYRTQVFGSFWNSPVYIFMDQNIFPTTTPDQIDTEIQKSEAARQLWREGCARGRALEIATRPIRAKKIAEKQARHAAIIALLPVLDPQSELSF